MVIPFSLSTAEIPFLLMVRSALVEIFSSTQRFSSGMKKRFFCRFGINRRFDLMFEWDTLWPLIDFFPETSQTFDMMVKLKMDGKDNGTFLFCNRKSKTAFFREWRWPVPIIQHVISSYSGVGAWVPKVQ